MIMIVPQLGQIAPVRDMVPNPKRPRLFSQAAFTKTSIGSG